ncbi:MAG: M48 family metallopeptidase [Bacteroidales bacterium]|nr:M48 family metallopeptidase [Bacteroidales bacterium]
MEIYNTLDDVICETGRLMKLSKKELADISNEMLFELFDAAERHIILKTQELADTLGFDKLNSVRLVCFKRTNRLGTCDKNGNIKIDFKTLFGYEYSGIISVIVHELCHTKIHNHSREFWSLFEQSSKKVGILSPEYDGWTEDTEIDSPFMYKHPWKYKDHPQKYKIIQDIICTPYSLWGVHLVGNRSFSVSLAN